MAQFIKVHMPESPKNSPTDISETTCDMLNTLLK